MSTPGDGRFGPYRLIARLGAGGMGEVWRATDGDHGDRVVAVKLLPPGLADDADFEARFRRESQLASRLTSPHMVAIHRYGEIDGRLFIDMQLVEGTDLAALLTRDGPLPVDDAVDVIGQVADALDAAHAAGLVHRDVKPGNVRRTPDGFVYLLDFGLAVPLHEATSLTAAGDLVGTFQYMAPERFRRGPADRRSDVYALGALFYACLTGRHPFLMDDLPTAMYAHLFEAPPRPSERRDALPAGLDEVVAGAMAKDPDDRFPTAGALARAARAALVPSEGSPAADRRVGDAAAEPQDAVVPVAPEDPAPRPARRRALLALGVVGVGAVALGGYAAWPSGGGTAPPLPPVPTRSHENGINIPAIPGGLAPRQVARSFVGSPPTAASMSPAGELLWIACEVSGIVGPVNLRGGSFTYGGTGGGRPTGVAVSPDGTYTCVVDYDAGRLAFEGATVGYTELPAGPRHVAIAPDNRRVFVSIDSTGQLLTVDAATRAVVGAYQRGVDTTPLPTNATTAIAVVPDGSLVALLTPLGEVVGIETAGMRTGWITSTPADASGRYADSPTADPAAGLAVNPVDGRVYVSAPEFVAAFRDGTFAGAARIPGGGPLAVSRDGRLLYVGLPATNTVLVTDTTRAFAVVDRHELGGRGMAFLVLTPDGRRLCASDASTGEVVVLALA